MKEQTQRQKILALLKQMGSAGVNSHDLTYLYSVKQAPTRIKELRNLGFNIYSSKVKSNRSVQYILIEGSTTPKQISHPIYKPWEEGSDLVRYEKIVNGEKRYFWDKPEKLEPKQEALF